MELGLCGLEFGRTMILPNTGKRQELSRPEDHGGANAGGGRGFM